MGLIREADALSNAERAVDGVGGQTGGPWTGIG